MENLKKYTPFKIILTVLYIVITGFLLFAFIDALNKTGEHVQLGIALTYAIVVILFGGIAYGVSLVLGLIGLIISAIGVKRNYSSIGTLVYFIVFTALPIVTYLLMIFIMPIFVD